METVDYGKKRYYILLVLSVITTLLLPLICTSISVSTFSKTSANSYATVTSVIYPIGLISNSVGSAVLIFAAIRYRFKFCLPFAVIAIVENIFVLIVELTSASINNIPISSVAYSIINIVLSWAVLFAYIGIARVSAKHIKKEAIVVLVIFLGMLIVSLFVSISSHIVSLRLMYIQNPGGSYAFALASSMTSIIKSTIIRSLRSYLYMTVAYLIIKLIFTDNKREKFRKILSITKSTAKKLWDSTAK